MNKKTFFLASISVVAIIVAVMLFSSKEKIMNHPMTQSMDDVHAKVKRSEGNILVSRTRMELELFKTDNERYPTWQELSAIQKKLEKELELKNYKIHIQEGEELNPEVQKSCSDCHLSADSFKVAIYGNIDKDAFLDIHTINQDLEVVLVQDDVGNQH